MIQDKIYDALKESAFLYLDDFMNISLRDEEHGYYTSNKAIGKDGDFVTAPEISQMFGELIGLWVVQAWMDHNKPPEFSLVELGPGNGTLMEDILRATKSISEFHKALKITFGLKVFTNLKKFWSGSQNFTLYIFFIDLIAVMISFFDP